MSRMGVDDSFSHVSVRLKRSGSLVSTRSAISAA